MVTKNTFRTCERKTGLFVKTKFETPDLNKCLIQIGYQRHALRMGAIIPVLPSNISTIDHLRHISSVRIYFIYIYTYIIIF